MNARYKNPDNDPRGVWKPSDFSVRTYNSECDYPITLPSGRIVSPPESRAWVTSRKRFDELVADNRIWFGATGNNVPSVKKFLSEVKSGMTAMTLWKYNEVGHNQDAKKEVKTLDIDFATPKPERLIERVLTLGSNPGDLVLDSFLGSGTTAAIAHKMGRKYIGIELGEHCYTHCVPRLQKVIDGEQGGISKAVNWQGGGGFKFYELAPSLLVKDEHGFEVISEKYNADMLAAAVCKLCGYKYQPDPERYIHGVNNVGGYIFVTTNYITAPLLGEIARQISDTQSLVICASAFQVGIKRNYPNITLRKIPQTVLDKCEYGKDDYKLNIVELPDMDDCDEDFEEME